MSEFISEEQHHAEVAALNHEIYRLTKHINETERERAEADTPDPFDPFDNPTEYHEYRDDYTEILPPIQTPAYKVSLEPGYDERRRLKRFYAIGGWCAVLQFVASTAAGFFIARGIIAILKDMNPGADGESMYTFIKGSSILVGMNMLIYIFANVVFAFIGMKLADIKPSSLIKTRNYDVGKAVQYCAAAMFIWVISAFVSLGVNNVFEKYGYSTNVLETEGVAVTKLGFAISAVYTCIIAPVTEELFFRGMLLRTFSKANQRFAVFATAVFFGLAHGNLPQFTLAFLLGIFLAHITLKHGSIIPSIVVHVFVNTVVTIMGELDLSDAQMIAFNLGLEAFAAFGALMLLIFRSKDKLPATTPAQSKRGFVIARCSVGVIVAFTIQAAYTLYLLFTNIKG
ncbi:MAG TPA: type II CAAX endopeptidase family protein [Ruminococcus sp.]|nr:type II CAAX endopeptidase family protein [Ruminococcus sp.]